MRFYAILFVLLGHGWFFIANDLHYLSILQHVFVFGVEIFFVLSGFLIGSVFIKDLETKGASRRTALFFWKRRWFRTLPNYILFLILNILAALVLKPDFDLIDTGLYFIFLQNFAWLPEQFFSVSWSLAVEEWFYILLPIGSLLLMRFLTLKNAILYLVLFIILVSVLIRLYAALVLNYKWNEELRLVVIYRFDSLMFGVFAAWFKRYYEEAFYKKAVIKFALGLLIVFSLTALKSMGKIEDPWLSALFFPLSSISFALMLPMLNSWVLVRVSLTNKVVFSISLWSYSIYLLHVPLLMIAKKLAVLYNGLYQFPFNFILFFTWITMTIITSKFIYEFFEKPLMNLRDKY